MTIHILIIAEHGKKFRPCMGLAQHMLHMPLGHCGLNMLFPDLINRVNPAKTIFAGAVLNACQFIVKVLRYGTGPILVYDVLPAHKTELANRGNHRCCSTAKYLGDLSGFDVRQYVVYIQPVFGGGVAKLRGQYQQGVSRNTRENASA